jgi:hypothetical protein
METRVDNVETREKRAYFHARRRGFVPGQDLNDWLAAEDEIDQGLPAEERAY